MFNNESIAVINRFVEALDYLKENGIIKGRNTFVTRYGLDLRNFSKAIKQPERNIFQICWLTYLVNDYNISALWLLTGSGVISKDIFNVKK